MNFTEFLSFDSFVKKPTVFGISFDCFVMRKLWQTGALNPENGTRRVVTWYHKGPYRGAPTHYPGYPTTGTHPTTTPATTPATATAATLSSPGSFWFQRLSHVVHSFRQNTENS